MSRKRAALEGMETRSSRPRPTPPPPGAGAVVLPAGNPSAFGRKAFAHAFDAPGGIGNAFQDSLYRMVVRETEGLPDPEVRVYQVGELRTQMLCGALSADPSDGSQRDVVVTGAWMAVLAGTMAGTPVPIDSLMANLVGDCLFVGKGKQRVSALLAVLSGRVPMACDRGEPVYLQDSRDPPFGHEYMFDPANLDRQGRRSRAKNVPSSLRAWFRQVDAALARDDVADQRSLRRAGVVPALAEDAGVERFLARELVVQVTPNWPTHAFSLTVLFAEITFMKQTPHECIYGIPNMQSLRELEPRLNEVAHLLEVSNREKQAFSDMARAYLCLTGACEVPMAEDERNFIGAISTLTHSFLGQPESGKPAGGDATAISDLRMGLETLRARAPIIKATLTRGRRFSSDQFAAMLLVAAADPCVTAEKLIRVHSLMSKTTLSSWKKDLPKRKLDLWKKTRTTRNLANMFQTLQIL